MHEDHVYGTRKLTLTSVMKIADSQGLWTDTYAAIPPFFLIILNKPVVLNPVHVKWEKPGVKMVM